MTIAIFSLIGVILGGIISAGSQYFLDWNRERTNVRRAKLLVAGELIHAQLVLRSLAKVDYWPPSLDPDRFLPSAAWLEQRTYLADQLREDQWVELVLTYAELEVERLRLVVLRDPPPNMAPTEQDREHLRHTAATLAHARQALVGCRDWPDHKDPDEDPT